MVQDIGVNEERRHVKRLEFGCQCRFLRSYIISSILLVLLMFYYIDPSVVLETWTSTVGVILSETYTSANILLASERSPEPWTRPERYYVAYPHKYHFLINEPDKCQKENTFVVLMVPIASSNIVTRDAIRATWGTERLVENKVVSVFFLLGYQQDPQENEKLRGHLQKESKKYHDLLQSDFLDSYHNLTIKTMVMHEWLAEYCRNASYAMKVDSDVFLNVKNLVRMLLSAPTQNYMTGLVTKGMVVRDPRSKWFLPKSVFSPAIYPPYALGLGYVFSLDLPEKLVKAAKNVKAVYIEDVYLGMCMKHLGISPTVPPTGGLFNVFPVKYNRCRYSKLIATTTRSLRDQVEFWKDLQKPSPPC